VSKGEPEELRVPLHNFSPFTVNQLQNPLELVVVFEGEDEPPRGKLDNIDA
jgi:hypothetical protein